MRRHAAPIIAVLLVAILPINAYVAAYLAFVEPGLTEVVLHREVLPDGRISQTNIESHYKGYAHHVSWMFWPLEQIDRKIRPDDWTY